MHLSARARRRWAWLAPLAVAGVIAGAAALSTAPTSSASPALPPLSARQLLEKVQTTPVRSLSGTVHESASFGLPSLPDTGSAASLSWQSFLTGTHDARVWVRGVDQQRVALLGQLSEADIVHDGRNLWTYTSNTNTVTHTVLPRHSSTSTPDAAYSPRAVADHVLEAAAPTTSITVARTQVVAGRNAYTLVLRPRDMRSTVRKVAIAVDARTFIPLQVQIFGAAATPAFQVGFSSLSYNRPGASHFTYSAPAGARVSANPFSSMGAGPDGQDAAPHGPAMSAQSPRIIGHGWTTVVELSGPHGSLPMVLPGGASLNDLTTRMGTGGERLLHTALVNAVMLPDGRIFAGAVSPAMLEHIAANTPH